MTLGGKHGIRIVTNASDQQPYSTANQPGTSQRTRQSTLTAKQIFTPATLVPPPEVSRCQSLRMGPLIELAPLPRLPHGIDGMNLGLRKLFRQLITGHEPWPLFLYGDTGSGKTCAALTLVDHYGGWYTTVDELHGLVQSARAGTLWWPHETGGKISVMGLWRAWSEVNVAVLDEVGLRKLTEPAAETLKIALDKREFTPSVVISNFSVEELTKRGLCDARVAGRVACGTAYQLTGDRRMEQREKQKR